MALTRYFVFEDEGIQSGIFLYVSAGVLSGLEVYGQAEGAPRVLPTAEQLRPFIRGE